MRARRFLFLLLSLVFSACAQQVTGPQTAAPRPTPEPTLTPARISRPTSEAEKARALAASVDLVAANRCGEAIALLDVLLDAYPEMEDYHLFHLATCAAELGDHARATAAWSRLLTVHPRSIHTAAAQLAWGKHLHASDDDAGAEPLLRRATATEDLAIVHSARFDLAEIDLARQNVRSSYAAFSELRADAGGDLAKRAGAYVLALRTRYPELAPRSERERDSEARLLLREGDHAAALRLANALLAAAAAGDRPRFLRLRALIELGSGDSQRYLSTLREIHTGFPGSGDAAQAIFEEARWLWNKDRDEEAAKVFLEIERRFPRHDRIATVEYALARIAQGAGDNATAASRFRSVINRYPNSVSARESRWQLAWIRYYAGQWDAAESELAQLARGKSAANAADAVYWRGRALERAGRSADARAAFASIAARAPDSYYAMRADERLGQGSRYSIDRVAAAPAAFPALPPSLRDAYHLTRARALHAARLNSFARRELQAFVRDESAPPRDFMIDAYVAVDGHRQAMRLATGRSGRYADLLYPLAFWDLLVENASRYRIDPLLALSLMRQESLFDPEALSPANARGLMQLLPTTAADVAARIGRGGPIDLYDPATNIELGTAHLRELADLYQGDHVRILAAYNAGASAVAKWDRRYAGRERDEYVESISYSETRDYVKKVLSNYRKYQRLYGK